LDPDGAPGTKADRGAVAGARKALRLVAACAGSRFRLARLVLWRPVIPFRGTIAATGNDFIQLYWVYKAYLLDYLTRFSVPLWSPSEGAGCPFGATGVMLLVLYVASVAGARVRDERRLCVVLITWSLLVSCVSSGENSIAFSSFQSLLPGFSRLRVWGRVSIVLLPLLAWLLARAFEHFARLLAEPAAANDRRRQATSVLLGALLVMCALQGAQVFVGYVNLYYIVYLPELRGFAAWSMLGTGLAFLALRSLMVVARRRPGAGISVATTVAVLLAASAIDVWPMGPGCGPRGPPFPDVPGSTWPGSCAGRQACRAR